MTTPNLDQLIAEAGQMINDGQETEKVKSYLALAGAVESDIETIVSQLKAQVYLRKRKRGVMLGAIGSVLLVIGFLLTVFFYHSGISIHYVMYGMTSVGVILLFVGMIDILGWG